MWWYQRSPKARCQCVGLCGVKMGNVHYLHGAGSPVIYDMLQMVARVCAFPHVRGLGMCDLLQLNVDCSRDAPHGVKGITLSVLYVF